MENYNKIHDFCNENAILLLTSFNEFENKRNLVLKKSYNYVRIDFIGTCGHPSSAVVTNFLTRKTGFVCKECVRQKSKISIKNKSATANAIETDAIKIINIYLSNTYNIIKTKEGCRADLIIQKKGDIDKYIPIQVKSTEQMSHKMYSFRKINKDYNNMIIVCVCTSENKIWVFPHKDVAHLEYLNISSRSKYNKYMINDNNLLNLYIEKHVGTCYTNKLTEFMTPICEFQKREQEYVGKREKIINYLKYEYPEIQNTPTDFIVNGKKVQEKVGGLCKNRGIDVLVIYLSSHNGKKENNKRKFRTYRLGENDYYWIHSSIDERFWIIPEMVLYNKGYISAADETKGSKSIQIRNSTIWIKEYEYNYTNHNRDLIAKLFI